MRKFLMIASAAAMAVSMPALAEKGGKGGGGQGGGGKGHAAHAQGGGGGKEARGGGGGGAKPAKAERQASHGGGGGGGAKPHKAERQAFHGGGKPARAERQASRGGGNPDKAERQAFRAPKEDRKAFRQAERQVVRVNDMRGGNIVDTGDYRDGDRRYASLGGGAACPPGLAKKGCMPPGQAKKAFKLGQQVQPAWFSGYNLPAQYSAFYPDSGDDYYRYSDKGYIYRIDSRNNLVSGLIPLLGGGFGVGQAMPAGYDVYNVPYQYRDDFYDTDDSLYRYGDDAIYQVDPQSGVIESIVALLGGGDLGIGQALPSGYDAYNVPMDYRDQYQDTDESMYRYADGNIYQVDTKTQIIQAIMEMLV
jgi:hypothetical protein